jgi:pimeloyl-ACP methyl ester carboxylesterase
MIGKECLSDQRYVTTPSGTIGCVDRGTGPVALFVHGVLRNGYFWRNQLANLADLRRCIAVDLWVHGATTTVATQDMAVTANAQMLAGFLDALKVDRVDLVGNDSGGGICQIFAALYLERVHSLTLTDCDAHDDWPPEAFRPFVAMVAAGRLPETLRAMLADKSKYRSPQALGPAYEKPDAVADATIDSYLRPHLRSASRTHDLERFVNAFDCRHTVSAERRLRCVQAPTLIVWGTDDIYFDQMIPLAAKSDFWYEETSGAQVGAHLCTRRALERIQCRAAKALADSRRLCLAAHKTYLVSRVALRVRRAGLVMSDLPV